MSPQVMKAANPAMSAERSSRFAGVPGVDGRIGAVLFHASPIRATRTLRSAKRLQKTSLVTALRLPREPKLHDNNSAEPNIEADEFLRRTKAAQGYGVAIAYAVASTRFGMTRVRPFAPHPMRIN
jgi:hypothetical protein